MLQRKCVIDSTLRDCVLFIDLVDWQAGVLRNGLRSTVVLFVVGPSHLLSYFKMIVEVQGAFVFILLNV